MHMQCGVCPVVIEFERAYAMHGLYLMPVLGSPDAAEHLATAHPEIDPYLIGFSMVVI